MASWAQIGDLANVAQLTGLNAVQLIGLIVRAAATARMHRRNCRQFAHHLKLIGDLLDQLRVPELRRRPEAREPLEALEDALRRGYALVDSCQSRSFLYLLAMGWSIVNQFRRAQAEIDRILAILPLITLVDNARVREKLEYIEKDQREYTLDEEDKMLQDAILDCDPSRNHTKVLKKSLSCSYPNLPFDEALQKENEKLELELQRSQSNLDTGQCEVIQHLLGVTHSVASSLHKKNSQLTSPEKDAQDCQDANYEKEGTGSGHEFDSNRGSKSNEEWQSDLLGCCADPSLCIRTFFYPCGTFSRIATITKNRYISSAEACNELMAYSLLLSCCCYTCCVRRKLRKMLNIKGGLCDDFLSHLMCCCCALVQEWRELEIRGLSGNEQIQTRPPTSQHMEY